jgi:hypothetical protein
MIGGHGGDDAAPAARAARYSVCRSSIFADSSGM